MATIKKYNDQLKSLGATSKITRTMKMVSASKLQRAQQAQINAKLYAETLAELTSRIAVTVKMDRHPLFFCPDQVSRILILIITSNKGLCGAFNHNANRRVANWIKENAHHQKIDIYCCGKQGYLFFNKNDQVKKYDEDVTENPQFSKAMRIGQEISDAFIQGEYDEVYITYNQFFSPLSQKTVFEKILPIDPHALIRKKLNYSGKYLFEPKVSELLKFLVPHFLYFKIYFALLENAAGEHGARMTAMDNATKNATKLMDQYTLLRNRARQTAITTELTEIIAGAEALN